MWYLTCKTVCYLYLCVCNKKNKLNTLIVLINTVILKEKQSNRRMEKTKNLEEKGNFLTAKFKAKSLN